MGHHGGGGGSGQREAQRAQADAHDVQAVVGVMEFLRAGEGAWRTQPSGQEKPPVVLELLHRAVGPAVTLTPVALEGLRDEAAAVWLGEVNGLVAGGVNADRQFGVFGQAPLGPAAGPFQGSAPDERHGADSDSAEVLVQAHHAGGEEDGVLPVRPPAERGLGIAPIGVRALHESDGGIGEVPGGGAQPPAPDLVVGVHHGDQFRPRAGVAQRPVQRARLGAGDPLDMQEPEPRAEPLAVGLDRPPQLKVGGVVVNDQDLEVGVVKPGQAIQRADHDLKGGLGPVGAGRRQCRGRLGPAGPALARRPGAPLTLSLRHHSAGTPGLSGSPHRCRGSWEASRFPVRLVSVPREGGEGHLERTWRGPISVRTASRQSGPADQPVVAPARAGCFSS